MPLRWRLVCAVHAEIDEEALFHGPWVVVKEAIGPGPMFLPEIAELHYQRWLLVEHAVTNPTRTYDEIDDIRPTQMRPAFGPGCKVDLLEAIKIASTEYRRRAFILQGLLSIPSDCERTVRSGEKIAVLARTLHSVENDFKPLRYGDPDERRLRPVFGTNGPKNAKFTVGHEIVNIALGHVRRGHQETITAVRPLLNQSTIPMIGIAVDGCFAARMRARDFADKRRRLFSKIRNRDQAG